MKSLLGALGVLAVIGGLGCLLFCATGCTGFNAKTQTGPMQTGPGQNAGVYAERGVLGNWKAGIVGPDAVTATDITVNKTTGEVKITGANITSHPVEFTDAQTRKINEAFLPMSKENTELNRVYGENTVRILAGMSALATSILDGLPAGQLKQAAVEFIHAWERSKATATQPAIKNDPVPVASQ